LRLSRQAPAVLAVMLGLAGGMDAQQRASAVFVTAASPVVTAGDTSQLTAVGVDSTGKAIPAAQFKWSLSDASALTVDANGVVTANALGWADIYADQILATGTGPRGTIRLQSMPLAINVHPAIQTLKIGDTIQYSADTLDVNGQPMPGVPLLWRAYGANSTTNNSVGIDGTGFVSTYGWGTFFIEAYFNYSSGSGFPQRVVGNTLLTVLQPAKFSAVKLLDSSAVRQGFELRERRGQISVNDSGQIAYTGFLEGFASASLLWQNGAFTVLSVAGGPAELPGSNLQDMGEPALNNNGEVVANCMVAPARGCLMFAGTDGTAHQILFDGAQGGGVLNIRNFAITRFSLNDYSETLFRADYYTVGGTVSQNGLFVTTSSGQIGLVVAAGTQLPGMGTTYTFDRDFGMSNDGTIVFFATNGASRGIYRMTPDNTITRVIGTGDMLNGAAIQSLGNVAAGKNGQYAVEVNNGTQNLLLFSGDPSKFQQLPVTNWNQVYAVSGAGEAVFVCSQAPGYGVYRWNGSTVIPVVMQQTPSPTGDLFTQFDSAAITAAGETIVQARTANSVLMVVNMGASPGARQSVLFQPGAPVNVQGGPSFYNLVLNGHSGNPMIKTGWYETNVFEIANGTMVPRLISGDRTPDGWFYEGNDDTRQNADGDLFVATDQSVSQISQGGTALLAHYPQRVMNGNLYAPYQVAANTKGDVAGAGGTSFGINAISLVKNGAATPIAWLGSSGGLQTNAGGAGYFSSSSDMGMAEDGTLYALIRVVGGPDGVFSWNGSAWVSVLRVGDPFDSQSVTAINSIRVAGTILYANTTSTGGIQHISGYQAGQWTDIVSNGDTIPGSTFVTGIGSWDVNRNGTVAAVLYSNGGDVYVVSIGASGFNVAMDVFNTLSTGELLPSIFNVSVHDDGRVFAIAINQQDLMVLYEFDPLP
jgi:hypothetical protein